MAPKVPSEENNVKHRTEAREHKVEKQEEPRRSQEMTQQFHFWVYTPQKTVRWDSVCAFMWVHTYEQVHMHTWHHSSGAIHLRGS